MEVELSERVWDELERRSRETGGEVSAVLDETLREAFELDGHTLFQVSTSNALAQGVFGGAVTVATLKEHGDFGIGTFERLDGELILLEGTCYRATAGGVVGEISDDAEVPFAAVTWFTPDIDFSLDEVTSLDALRNGLDSRRLSDNLFQGLRVDGRFESLQMRAACPARPGEGLLEATRHQSEFSAADVEGTLVGFWAPEYAQTVGIPGYHFHFISEDRGTGGHLLDLAASRLEVQVQTESSLHLAMPDTSEFRAAELGGDHRDEIDQAETGIGN